MSIFQLAILLWGLSAFLLWLLRAGTRVLVLLARAAVTVVVALCDALLWLDQTVASAKDACRARAHRR